MRKIPVGATVAYAYRFAFGNAPTLLRVLWLPLLSWLVLLYFLFKRSALFLAAAQAQDPSMVTLFGPVLLLVPAIFILFFVQLTAAMETALGDVPQGWFTFPIGKKMWRLLGGFLAALLAIVVIAVIAFFAVTLIAVAFNLVVKTAPAPLVRFMAGLLGVLFFCVLVFASIRFLFLLPPANLSESSLGLARAWHLSAGNFWRALAITLAIMVPIVLVNYAYTFSITVLPPLPANTSKEAMQAWETALRISELNSLTRHWYFTLPLMALLMLFQFGVGCAAQVFALRALTEETSAPG